MYDARLDLGYVLQILRDEETRICTTLALVRRKLNELSPISQLPTEILEEVFNICVSWIYDSRKPKHRLAWTQVCSSWRRISLGSSRLWQRIDLCDAPFADEFLVRSRKAPLIIVSASPLQVTTINLAAHANRLRTIDVFLYSDVMRNFFTSIGANLSALASLSLKVPSFSPTVYLPFSVPHLRRLSLDGVAMPWEDFQNLTHLSLRSISPELCPSISQVHDICSRSPNLEHIRIEGLIPSCHEITSNSKLPVTLLDLKEFIISGEQQVISTLLSGLILGPFARLRLFTSLTDNLHSLFPQGSPWIEHCRSDSAATIRLSRNGAHVSINGARAWSEEPSQTLFSLSSAVSVRTCVTSSLNHLFVLSNVTKLELNSGMLSDISIESLQILLTNLMNLETLCVAFNELDDLLSILRDTQPTSGRCYAPRLKNLSFSKPADLWFHFKDRWLTAVIDLARFRQNHSLPIHAIEFLRCHGITQNSTEDLQTVVGQIIIAEKMGMKSRF